MKNRWSDEEASGFVSKYAAKWGEDLALRTYSGRLIGSEGDLVLHGGGNVSVKSTITNVLGENVAAVFVKTSGRNLSSIEPDGHTALDLVYLSKLRALDELSDERMSEELLTHKLGPHVDSPSIEALLHAFIPQKFIDHTHADAVLALTNRPDGEAVLREVFGDDVAILDYIKPGFGLAKAASAAYEGAAGCSGMVLLKHGLLTWGESARESYDRTISLVTLAEKYLASKSKERSTASKRAAGAGGSDSVSGPGKAASSDRPSAIEAGADAQPTPYELARGRYIEIAPVLRGALALPSGDEDRPHKRFILRPLITEDILKLVDSKRGKEIALTPPLTSDHLIRTKALPLWIDKPGFGSAAKAATLIPAAIADYAKEYDEYFRRNSARLAPDLKRFDSMPRVILMPGLGAVCVGRTVEDAEVVRDITEHTLLTKVKVFETGVYEGLDEEHLFDMEYFSLQREKLRADHRPPLERTVALVTGAVGAIGSGVSEELLKNGCHVAVTDLPGEALESFGEEIGRTYGGRVLAAPLDVTDPKSVSNAMDRIIETWGGVDLVVVNAGIAHVSSLAEMNPDDFRRLERVNVEGTLHVLSEAARHFKLQGTGGDVVLVSTKNVFAPGAEFGAYSATKAAAHQLARIASLELAPIGVRVNMVSPDAVFGREDRRSGLWAEVKPNRMKARGLDEEGLEAYYRSRNLLKARVKAEHVANAVMFFATRKTPTTGATIPVDGGLPDSTPR